MHPVCAANKQQLSYWVERIGDNVGYNMSWRGKEKDEGKREEREERCGRLTRYKREKGRKGKEEQEMTEAGKRAGKRKQATESKCGGATEQVVSGRSTRAAQTRARHGWPLYHAAVPWLCSFLASRINDIIPQRWWKLTARVLLCL